MPPTAISNITAEELLRRPRDGFRYELIRGELVQMTPAGNDHGFRAMRFGWRLAQHVESHDLGRVYAAETGFQIASDPDTVRAPDVAFVSQARIDEVGTVLGYWPGAPDLAVEVVSPHDTYTEVDEKVAEWLAAGARMVIVINPRRETLAVHRPGRDISVLGKADTLDAGDVVPGWMLRVADLFP